MRLLLYQESHCSDLSLRLDPNPSICLAWRCIRLIILLYTTLPSQRVLANAGVPSPFERLGLTGGRRLSMGLQCIDVMSEEHNP